MSFTTSLALARGKRAEDDFDGKPTIDAVEAKLLVDVLANAPSGSLIDMARNLMDAQGAFADRAALEIFRSGVFAQGRRTQRLDQAGWKKLGGAAQAAFSSLPGKVSVIYPAANGGRPVLVFVPNDLDRAKPARLVTYFHGRLGNLSTDYAALIKRVGEVAPKSQAVYVFAQGWLTDPAEAWMDPAAGESFAGLESAAVAEANVAIEGRTVIAHSNGGFALANAARSGELRADRLRLFDCLYERAGVRVWETIGQWAARAKAEVFFVPATNAQARIEALVGQTSTKVEPRSFAHGEIPSNCFLP